MQCGELPGTMRLLEKVSLFQKAEVAFERRLQERPYYPFHEVHAKNEFDSLNTLPVFTHSARLKQFYLALVSTIAIFLFLVIWPSADGDNEYLVLAVLGLAISIYCTVEFYSVRTIVLDPSNSHYSLYRGSMLTATQHCHNIYIRMLCNRTGPRHPTYHLVLDGVGMDASITLTGESTNRRKLRHLAHELAGRLHINYFDVHNSSKHHVVRHHRPNGGHQEAHEE